MYTNQLNALAEMSNKYGADPRFVLAGGGNTSYKSSAHLFFLLYKNVGRHFFCVYQHYIISPKIFLFLCEIYSSP